MLTVVCMWWSDPQGRNNAVYQYNAGHVITLQRMVRVNLTLPHRFVCMTDGHVPGVETVPLDISQWPAGKRLPKLTLFRRDIADLLGAKANGSPVRLFYLDLDCVLTGNIDSIVDRPEPLVLWKNPHYGERKRWAPFNSSMILMDAGVRPDIYEGYDAEAAAEHWAGDDQDWISAHVKRSNPHWTHRHGVWNQSMIADCVLPENARIVHFPGKRVPWMPEMQDKHPWLWEYAPC